ncbi:MAG: type II secretion system protein [Candidatus Gastranaerophilaceae bacterium]
MICYNNGFTLAEVLITLGIIGIVAALTMPVVARNGCFLLSNGELPW